MTNPIKYFIINATLLYQPIKQKIEDGSFTIHLTDVKHRFNFYPNIVEFKEISRDKGHYTYEFIVSNSDLRFQWLIKEKQMYPLQITNITFRDEDYYNKIKDIESGEASVAALRMRLKGNYRGYIKESIRQISLEEFSLWKETCN